MKAWCTYISHYVKIYISFLCKGHFLKKTSVIRLSAYKILIQYVMFAMKLKFNSYLYGIIYLTFRCITEGMTYKSSGVDIESADALVDTIKSLTKQTLRLGVCGGIGGFGGIFDLKAANYSDSYLISRGSGIGEKLVVRFYIIFLLLSSCFVVSVQYFFVLSILMIYWKKKYVYIFNYS